MSALDEFELFNTGWNCYGNDMLITYSPDTTLEECAAFCADYGETCVAFTYQEGNNMPCYVKEVCDPLQDFIDPNTLLYVRPTGEHKCKMPGIILHWCIQ
jgi:hypothetical protein